MTPREAGFLLLTSHLGNPDRKVLTAAQLRNLAQRVCGAERSSEVRELNLRDLQELGYDLHMAARILELLSEQALLEHYLHRAKKAGCVPVTRVSDGYPRLVRRRLGLDSPGCLWAKGDLSLLDAPKITLVGSRELAFDNRCFAAEAGYQAAKQGYVLVSGNAKGADRTAQDACLLEGGGVISVVADELETKFPRENTLYLSEVGFDLPFTPQRALSRKRVIHCLGSGVLVAQCSNGTGGTWDGTVKNLRFGWCRVCCYDDGSEGISRLVQMGAEAVGLEDLQKLSALEGEINTLFDQ